MDGPPSCPACLSCGWTKVWAPSYWVCSPPFSVSMSLSDILREVIDVKYVTLGGNGGKRWDVVKD